MLKKDRIVAIVFALLAAALYFALMAGYVFPGESARLVTLWRGLDVSTTNPYPLMSVFARMFGCTNALSPICGVIATVLIFWLVRAYIFSRMPSVLRDDNAQAQNTSLVGGAVAAALFMFAPAVLGAAAYLEPRMFDFTWLLIAGAAITPFVKEKKRALALWVRPIVAGALWGLGATDSPLFFATLPIAFYAIAVIATRRDAKPYGGIVLFLAAFATAFLIFLCNAGGDFNESATELWSAFRAYFAYNGWFLAFGFSTLPFLISIFAAKNSFDFEDNTDNDDIAKNDSFSSRVFHIALAFIAILAVATPLQSSSIFSQYSILPVASCGFASAVGGYVVAYWFFRMRGKSGAMLSRIIVGVLGFVFTLTIVANLFGIKSDRGAFADKAAAIILDDLGNRTWLVADGMIDNHLRIMAADRGINLDLISLARDLDKDYLEKLGKRVRERKVGGEEHAENLSRSLTLGVLPFLQDWFRCDSSVTTNVAVFGTADLWYSAKKTPVPEFMFFGADPSRKVDWSRWKDLAPLLGDDENWGSNSMFRNRNPLEICRSSLRRHIGLVANNRGVWLQDNGRNDEAFELYEMVINEIDSDNVSSLFNLMEMVRANYPKAVQKKNEYKSRIEKIVADKTRRYVLWKLAMYYGYVRNPLLFVRLGYEWAASGNSGEALAHINRAIDLVPSGKNTGLLNMMASLYANSDEKARSKEVYEQVLASDARNHDALIGLVRLSIDSGDAAQAAYYLQRAIEVAGDDPRAEFERAMLSVMQGDLAAAKVTLRAITDKNANDMSAWSLLAGVVFQQYDSSKEKAERLRYMTELEENIMPAMLKCAKRAEDFNVQSVRAMIYMRKPGIENVRIARDAFAVAAKSRPNSSNIRDIVLDLDMQLNDREQAEQHARDILRHNRNHPKANYIMGSIALSKGENDDAISYLLKAVDGEKPMVLAYNDLSEAYRKIKKYDEALRYARKMVKAMPNMYIGYDTLANILLDSKGDADEALAMASRAVEMVKEKGKVRDVRMLITLARAQAAKGDNKLAGATLRKVQSRISELSPEDKAVYDAVVKDVR